MNLRTKIISLAVAVVSAAGTAIAAEPFAIRPEGADKIVTCPLQSESKPLSWQANKGDSVRFSYAVPESAYQHEPSPVKVRVSVLTHGAWKSLFEESLDPAKNAEDRGWHRQKADLSSFAGEKVELKFTSRRASGRNNAPVAVWGGVRVGNFHRKPGEFNVILISLDTLRADRLSASGYKRETSPEIDAIAKAGVYFPRAVSQATWTKPSHMSIFTSLYPSIHGMEAHFGDPHEGRRLPERFPMLTEILRDRGYLTQAYTGSAHVSAKVGFDRGFDQFTEFARVNNDDGMPAFTEASDWIKEHADDKFFVFLHTYEIHAPYRHTTFVKEGMNPQEKTNAAYDSGVRYASTLVGSLTGQLRKLGIYDDTLIVILSDHGESLGGHGLSGHGHSLYDELVLVPLIFSLPNRLVARKLDNLNVELVDVFPTVCDLLGIPAPAGLMGRSLKPLLTGGDRPGESVGMSEITYSPHTGRQGVKRRFHGVLTDLEDTPPIDKNRLISVRYSGTGRYKMIYGPSFADKSDRRPFSEDWDRAWRANREANGRQLFDLANDPAESTNIASKDPTVFQKLLQRFTDRIAAGPRPLAAEGKEAPVAVDPSVREKLRALGY